MRAGEGYRFSKLHIMGLLQKLQQPLKLGMCLDPADAGAANGRPRATISRPYILSKNVRIMQQAHPLSHADGMTVPPRGEQRILTV